MSPYQALDDRPAPSLTLATMEPEGRHLRTAFAAMALMGVVNLLLWPFGRIQWPAVDVFPPIYETAMFMAVALTSILVILESREILSLRFLILGAGYLFYALMIILHLLSFPDVPSGAFLVGDQTPAYIWTLWHGGFPLFVIAFASVDKTATIANFGRSLAIACGLVLLLVVALGLLTHYGDGILPNLVEDSTFTPLYRLGIATGLTLLNLAALTWLWYRDRCSSVLSLWLLVTMLAVTFEVCTPLHSGALFTLGWYGARVNGLLGSILVLPVFLVEHMLLIRHHRQMVAMAESANAAKDRFLAAASHDLRQPFQAMRLLHAVLETTSTGPRQTEILDGLGNAMTAGESLLTSLLDISKLNAGQMAPTIEPVPVAEVIRSVAAECAPLAQKKGLHLKSHCPDMTVMTDKTMLRRVVANLTTNALRYTENGGVLVACRRRRGTVSIEVWDTGIGIPQSQIKAIFEEFYQVGTPQRTQSQGVGLGLSIVDRICRLLSYRLSVRSRVGKGSVFSVGVPL